MSFRRGEPGNFADRGGPSPDSTFSPFVDTSELRVVGKVAWAKTGSRVRFWPDRQIFLKEATVDLSALHDRARQTSFLVLGWRSSSGTSGVPSRSRSASSTMAGSPSSSSSSRRTHR